METIFHTGLVLLPVFYTILVMGYAKIFASRPTGLAVYVRPLLVGTVVLHLTTLVVRGAMVRACPMAQASEFLSLVGLCIATIYLLLELRVGVQVTGVFVLILSFALQIVATISLLVGEDPSSYPRGVVPSVHIFGAIVGYSAVAVSSVYAFLYLFLYRAIKRGSFGLYYKKMPSLDVLTDLNYTASWVGFLFLAITVGFGVQLWMDSGPVSHWDPALVLTAVLCLLYGAGIFGRRFLRLGGKRLAYTTVVGALCVIGMLMSGLISKGFHD